MPSIIVKYNKSLLFREACPFQYIIPLEQRQHARLQRRVAALVHLRLPCHYDTLAST